MRRNRKRLRINGFLGWLILFFLAWAFLSFIWADDIGLCLRRLLVLAMLCLGALAAAERFTVHDIIILVFSITALNLLIGLMTEIALGSFQPLAFDYRFGGALHPNQQGINCGLLVLSSFCLMENRNRGRGLFLAVALIAFACHILTKSRTSFASTLLALFVYGSLVLSRPRKFAFFLSVTFAFCLLLLVVGNNLFPALQRGILLGREESPYSLTGRVPLWKESLKYIARRPLQGYGYGSFWTPHHIVEVSDLQGWIISEGHSGYLEIALGLGLIGTVAYVLILIVGVKRSLAFHRLSLSTGYAFFVVLLVFGLSDGLLDPAIIMPSFLCFISFVALAYLGFKDTHFVREWKGRIAQT
jgi:O-antigen ligase